MTSELHTMIECRNFGVRANDASTILEGITTSFASGSINCIIGPSGSGKSTLLRSINRINKSDFLQFSGDITFERESVFQPDKNMTELRRRIGMLFQKPCVFPCNIGDNVLFGIRQYKKLTSTQKITIIKEQLTAVGLWEDLKDRLKSPASNLSVGQQQRLCLARALAMEPDVLLLDEPTSALDPASTRAIESLLLELKERTTIIIVTHNIAQARRIGDFVTYIDQGKVVEAGEAKGILFTPQEAKTKKYLEIA